MRLKVTHSTGRRMSLHILLWLEIHTTNRATEICEMFFVYFHVLPLSNLLFFFFYCTGTFLELQPKKITVESLCLSSSWSQLRQVGQRMLQQRRSLVSLASSWPRPKRRYSISQLLRKVLCCWAETHVTLLLITTKNRPV